MKPIHQFFFFFVVLFLACGTSKETPTANSAEKQIMVVFSLAIGQAILNESVVGLALDHEFVGPDKRDTVHFYKVLKSLPSDSTLSSLTVEKFNPFESSAFTFTPGLEGIANGNVDNDSLKFEFRDRIENTRDTFDFAYFTKSQIIPLLDRDSLVVYGAEIDLGNALGAIARDKHFTFKLEKKGNQLKINPALFIASFFPNIQVTAPPPFQIGIPCPPEWNPGFRSIKRAIEDSQ